MLRAPAPRAAQSLARRGSSSHQFAQDGLGWFGQPSALTRRPRQPLLAYILLRIPIPCAVVPSPVLHETFTSVLCAMRLTRRKIHVAAFHPYATAGRASAGASRRLYADCLLHDFMYFWMGRALFKCDCRAMVRPWRSWSVAKGPRSMRCSAALAP